MDSADTHLLLRTLVDELARCGLRTAITCPGSRNTPLIESIVAEERVRSWSHVDERSGSYFAVGAARAADTPVVITVTSGTAVANLLPAVIEASEAHLPLILLTADRPAELRQIGAGQTIDQVKIFGPYTRFFAELDLYEATPERMRWVRAMACRAFLTAAGADGGPVHLNIPLREPLVLDGPLPADPPGGEGRPGGRPWVGPGTAYRPLTAPADIELPSARRALIIAGTGGHQPLTGRAIADVAARAGLPLVADPLSGARHGASAIAGYDLILRSPEAQTALRPDLVIRFGDLPTSKPLRTWLAGLEGVEQVVVTPHPSWPDPASRMSEWIVNDRAALGSLGRITPAQGWLESWQAADATVASVVGPALGASGLSEPAVARALADRLPVDATLFVAASMPIRDVEEFFPSARPLPRVLANRGANGIDGTVSAAFGAAALSAGPTVLFVGDVTLLHDVGGLLAARRNGVKLTIVLINNDGGGIFNFLGIGDGSHGSAFSEHVATPHGIAFTHAAALYGLQHTVAADVDAFTAALDEAIRPDGPSTIIEVRTDRVANRALHAEIAAAATAALQASA